MGVLYGRRDRRRLRAFVEQHGITGHAEILADGLIVDERHAPYLQQFTESAETYYSMHLAYRVGGSHQQRVHASWGMIARGAESLPFLRTMLASREAESREDAAAAMGAIAKNDPAVVDALIAALVDETETEARDTVIQGLGRLGSRRAIPSLAQLISDPDLDGDTRWIAVESLGLIVRRRFLVQPDPAAAALEWLAKHPPGDL